MPNFWALTSLARSIARTRSLSTHTLGGTLARRTRYDGELKHARGEPSLFACGQPEHHFWPPPETLARAASSEGAVGTPTRADAMPVVRWRASRSWV